MYTRNEKIVPIHIEEEMKDSYINYAMSVIVGRALPDVRDGLKPVHRRILYAMRDLGLEHNKPYKKSARIVGECLGKYHPHGDTAVYDSLVRMVQDFSLRYPLIDGQGNFGCFTKDTKVRLTDGRALSFDKLIQETKQGRENYTYTYNIKTQQIEVAQIKFPRLTKKKAELLEIKLDNDEKIRSTLNHRFMLRDGTYKEAKELKHGDSLMPLYTRFSTPTVTPELYEKTRTNNGLPKLQNALNYFSDFQEITKQAKEKRNHKVKTIKFLTKREDVYDLTIDDTHNFALASGIFVHNSVDGDAAAAMRYTEARLERITDSLLQDLEKNTVKFIPNFDNSLTEPSVLPAVLPNLMLNGSSGIAVGMATNIPPHNLSEVIHGITYLTDKPDCEIKELMKIIKGPDFPTGGIICGKAGIKNAYETGRGRLLVHAKASVEPQKSGKESIVITEIPYQVNKNNLISSVANLVQEKKIEGITDLRDESDKDGMRIVVELRRGQNAQVVLNQLYKRTQMQTTYGVIMLALVDNRPRVLNLKEMLSFYIAHRKDVIIKRTKFDKEKAEARAHILEGLKIALKNLDKIISIIKKSKDPETAKKELIKTFDLSDRQAQAILEMQLQRLTNLEREKIDNEYKELIKKIEYLNSILASEKKVLGIIKDELGELNKKFGDERRTELMAEVEELEMEDLIQEEDVVITISHSGYIKRIPVSSYRKQYRGGKGITGADMKEDDFIEDLFIASTHDNILFFTNKGKAYVLKVYDIPQAGRAAKGKAIINTLSLSSGEQITSCIPVKGFEEGKFLMMATHAGKIKKTKLSAFANIRKSGIIAISLAKDDSLIAAKQTSGRDEVVIATKEGKAVRFSEKGIRDMGRSASGVRGIRLGKKDNAIGMEVVTDKEATLLSVTENGFSKRTQTREYRIQSRGGKGIINLKVTSKNGPVVGFNLVSDKDDLVIITSKGMVVRCAVRDMRATGRATQGVHIIKLAKGDKVASVAKVVKDED